jgi:hypothetical protein
MLAPNMDMVAFATDTVRHERREIRGGHGRWVADFVLAIVARRRT